MSSNTLASNNFDKISITNIYRSGHIWVQSAIIIVIARIMKGIIEVAIWSNHFRWE